MDRPAECTCVSELEDDAYGPGGPMSGREKPPPCAVHTFSVIPDMDAFVPLAAGFPPPFEYMYMRGQRLKVEEVMPFMKSHLDGAEDPRASESIPVIMSKLKNQDLRFFTGLIQMNCYRPSREVLQLVNETWSGWFHNEAEALGTFITKTRQKDEYRNMTEWSVGYTQIFDATDSALSNIA